MHNMFVQDVLFTWPTVAESSPFARPPSPRQYTATASTCTSTLLLSYLTRLCSPEPVDFIPLAETSTKLSYLNSVIVARAAVLSAHRKQPGETTPHQVVCSMHAWTATHQNHHPVVLPSQTIKQSIPPLGIALPSCMHLPFDRPTSS